MTTFDEQTNNDLPGEIHEWTEDPADREFYDQTFPCGHYQERWWDWNDDVIGPNADEPVWDDDEFDSDHEDDSWDDADSLASAGWGTDEDYGLWEGC
jgi:hypothetical protein